MLKGKQIIQIKYLTHLYGPLFTQSYQSYKTKSAQHKVQDFQCLKKLLSDLNTEKPTKHCILFKAAWNPFQEQADKDFEALSNQFQGYSFYRIDTDQSPLAKKYFGVKCEPETFIYMMGAKMTSQIGANATALAKKMTMISDYSTKVEILDGTNEWENPQAQWRREWEENHKVYDAFVR